LPWFPIGAGKIGCWTGCCGTIGSPAPLSINSCGDSGWEGPEGSCARTTGGTVVSKNS
jgi:hypothetical protein